MGSVKVLMEGKGDSLGILRYIRKLGRVLSEEHQDTGTLVKFRMTAPAMARFKTSYPALFSGVPQ